LRTTRGPLCGEKQKNLLQISDADGRGYDTLNEGEERMSILRLTLLAYVVSVVVLLVVFYVRERAKAGPISGRTILVMAEVAAMIGLLPATAYVLFSQLIKSGK
jgi:RsiW-degrading membrane proteinase PrsW (M82 family)